MNMSRNLFLRNIKCYCQVLSNILFNKYDKVKIKHYIVMDKRINNYKRNTPSFVKWPFIYDEIKRIRELIVRNQNNINKCSEMKWL